MKTISRRELRFILNKVKDKFNLDRVETKGICCGTCTAYEYRSYDKRVVWNKWFESGFNKTEWNGEKLYLSYSIDFNEMNEIGDFIVELLKEMGYNYSFERLEDNNKCLVLKIKN